MLARRAACHSRRFLDFRTISHQPPAVATDDVGIPKEKTWSLNDLISSLPTQELSADRLKHLHRLAALRPPDEGASEWLEMKRALEEGVRLVEGVRNVDVSGLGEVRERVMELELDWGDGVKAADSGPTPDEAAHRGRRLLSLAKRTEGSYYAVERTVRKSDG
jgi:Asp-tRNA(Asn)/Glu-tRNA(Gln) amidotransferase C subunit